MTALNEDSRVCQKLVRNVSLHVFLFVKTCCTTFEITLFKITSFKGEFICGGNKYNSSFLLKYMSRKNKVN